MSKKTKVVKWRPGSCRLPAFARVLAAIYAHRDQLREQYPTVPVGGFGVGGYWDGGICPLPVALLVTAWDFAPPFSGPCPECGGLGLGLCLGYSYTENPLSGFCLECALVVHKHLGLVPTPSMMLVKQMAHMCGHSLAADGYTLVAVPGATRHDWRPILAALGELGVDGLPKTLKSGRLSGAEHPRRPYA